MKYLRNKIIRPRYSNSLVIHIKSVDYAFHGKLQLTVKYFATDADKGFSDLDYIIVTKDYLLGHFEALTNPQGLTDFNEAEWAPLYKIEDYNEKKGARQ